MKMKNFLLFTLLGLSACQNGSPVKIQESRLIEPQKHLGEYLQRLNENEAITIDRDKEGIVIVNIQNNELTPLVSHAKNAKDLLLSEDRLLYRQGEALFLMPSVQNRTEPVPLSFFAEKVTSFNWLGDYGYLTYTSSQGKSFFKKIDQLGQIHLSQELPGIVRSSLLEQNESLWLALNNQQRLHVGLLQKDGFKGRTVEESETGDHAKLFYYHDILFLAYLDKQSGVLKLARNFKTSHPLSVEAVDGTPFESYLGMDLAIFEDGDTPGLLYLDGWQLKLRMARKKNQNWQSWLIPIKGATGFYTTVLQQKDQTLRLLTHNFRTDLGQGKVSFEDLQYLEISY